MNLVKVVKVASIAATILGTIGSAWVSSKENKIVLEELVQKHFENQ